MLSHKQVKKIILEHLSGDVKKGKLYVSTFDVLFERRHLAQKIAKYSPTETNRLKLQKKKEPKGLEAFLRKQTTLIEKLYIRRVKSRTVTNEFLKSLRAYAQAYNQFKIHTNQIDLLENVGFGDTSEILEATSSRLGMGSADKLSMNGKGRLTTKTRTIIKREPKFVVENEFVRKGDGWLIRFLGKDEFILPHFKGLTFIAYLIQNANQNIHCDELLKFELDRDKLASQLDEIDGTKKRDKYLADENEGELWSVNDQEEKNSPSDSKAVRAYLRRAKKIKEELEDGLLSEVKREEYLEELERISDELKKSGPQKKIGSDNDEKRKKAVNKVIKDVINSAINKHDEELANHLRISIEQRGIYFIYRHDENISWVVEPFSKKSAKI
jgi:hypothetical protein